MRWDALASPLCDACGKPIGEPDELGVRKRVALAMARHPRLGAASDASVLTVGKSGSRSYSSTNVRKLIRHCTLTFPVSTAPWKICGGASSSMW